MEIECRTLNVVEGKNGMMKLIQRLVQDGGVERCALTASRESTRITTNC